MTKWVYSFGGGAAEGRADMKDLLGGKGAGLAEMSSLGLPVPPGFTITTEVCTHFYAHNDSYPEELAAQVDVALGGIERVIGARLGDAENPLLVSVRSGARASMPGMMDTVLNLASTTRPSSAWPIQATTSASPMTVIAAFCRCTARSCWGSTIAISRR
jgi:pyruvate, orthophosphate dikinase